MSEQVTLLKDARTELVNSLTEIEDALESGHEPCGEEVEAALGNVGVVIEVLDD